jgi:hypothetical protein
MMRILRHSKGRALVTYLGLTALLGATLLTTDVALGFLSNAQLYLHIQPPMAADAVAGTSRTPQASVPAAHEISQNRLARSR